MRVVVAEFLSLDGVMEAPEKWSFQFWNDEIARLNRDELFASDAHLLNSQRNCFRPYAPDGNRKAAKD